MRENEQAQRKAFEKGRTPDKVVFHYSDGTTMEYLFHDPATSISVLAGIIQQITRFFK